MTTPTPLSPEELARCREAFEVWCKADSGYRLVFTYENHQCQAQIKAMWDAWQAAWSAAQAGRVDVERVKAALTPSSVTKAAYSGEFKFGVLCDDGQGGDYVREVYVPWRVIKEIMGAISKHALPTPPEQPSNGGGE